MQQLLSERIRLRSPFAYVLFVFSSVTAFKISVIQVQGYEKRNPTQIHKHGPKIIFENLNSRNLDRQLSVKQLIFMALILDLNNIFLEVLNTSQIYPNTRKMRFVKGLANYTKYVLNKICIHYIGSFAYNDSFN